MIVKFSSSNIIIAGVTTAGGSAKNGFRAVNIVGSQIKMAYWDWPALEHIIPLFVVNKIK